MRNRRREGGKQLFKLETSCNKWEFVSSDDAGLVDPVFELIDSLDSKTSGKKRINDSVGTI